MQREERMELKKHLLSTKISKLLLLNLQIGRLKKVSM